MRTNGRETEAGRRTTGRGATAALLAASIVAMSLLAVGGADAQRRGGFGGFGRRSAPPAKGADVQYRLKVPFADAAALKEQRVTLSGGKTIDLKLPKGVEDGTKIRLAGQGQPGPGGNGDAIVLIEIAPHALYIEYSSGDACPLEKIRWSLPGWSGRSKS